jgi:hypothetical protein
MKVSAACHLPWWEIFKDGDDAFVKRSAAREHHTLNAGTASASEASLEYGFLAPVTLYFDELDSLGMLHNGRYSVLAERAALPSGGWRGWRRR